MKVIEARTPEESQALSDTYAAQGYLSQEKLAKVLPVQEKRIVRCLNYLKMVIQNSEKESTHGLIPHAALVEPSEFCHAIEIRNSFYLGAGYRGKF